MKSLSKKDISQLASILLPFALFVIYNLSLQASFIFEFQSLNTARLVNSFIHTSLWAALGHFMSDVLSLLWTNLLWRNLAIDDEDKSQMSQKESGDTSHQHKRIDRKACSSETLSWLTSRPFSGLHNILKLKRGHLLAVMVFGSIYSRQAAQGLFTNLNPMTTILKGSYEERVIDAGWFHLTMPDEYILGSYTANLQVSTNEVLVEVDGEMRDVWLPPSLQLSDWYDVLTPVVLPKVTCYAEPLKGDWEGRTIYPFGRNSESECYAYLPFWEGTSLNQSRQVNVAGITLHERPDLPFSSFGCFDHESDQGLVVFVYGKSTLGNKENYTVPDDFGVIERNQIFGNLRFGNKSMMGIPCNYTLRTANVTFAQRNGKVRGTLQASSERNFELPHLRTIFDVLNDDLYFTTGNFEYLAALQDFMFDIQFITESTSRNLSYYHEKIKSLLGVQVYAHTAHPPLTVHGVPSTLYYKVQPVTSWWGILGTAMLCLSSLFVWWYTVAIGPKRAFWHSDSRDNSWNYLFAYFMPHMSPDDAYNKNTIYYEDGESREIKVDKVETVPHIYPGMRRRDNTL
jgi:hypothetical protein